MNGFKWIAMLVIVVMSGFAIPILLHDSLGHGAGLDVFLAGRASPWQAFINQDLVSGLLLSLTWLVYREEGGRVIDTIAWVCMVLWWGNIVIAAYVLVALREAEGDPSRFFMGARGGMLRSAWPTPGIAVRIILLALATLTAVYLAGLLRGAEGGVAIAGALLGILPVTLTLVLLAFPPALRTAAQ